MTGVAVNSKSNRTNADVDGRYGANKSNKKVSDFAEESATFCKIKETDE